MLHKDLWRILVPLFHIYPLEMSSIPLIRTEKLLGTVKGSAASPEDLTPAGRPRQDFAAPSGEPAEAPASALGHRAWRLPRGALSYSLPYI